MVIPAEDLKQLPSRLCEALDVMLRRIGLPEPLIKAELNEMTSSYFSKTESRKVLGSLNDFMFHLQDGCASDTSRSLEERAVQLAEMPSGAIEFAFPSEQTISLFQAKRIIKAAKSAA